LLAQSILSVVLLGTAMYFCSSQSNHLGILSELRLVLWVGGVPAVFLYILNTAVGDLGEFQFNMLLEYFIVLFAFFQSAYQVSTFPSLGKNIYMCCGKS
jgi:hypothetical protein